MSAPTPPARALALQVLLDWERGETYAQDLIERHATRHQLAHRDAALLQTLVFGVLRNISLLDSWLDELCSNKRLETKVHWLLRLGVAQLLILEMPPHAAVNETVSLADGKARGLVNAVLRRAERERTELLSFAESLPPHDRLSHPDWLIERWSKQYSEQEALKLCEWNQNPASTYIRINRLHPEPLDQAAVANLATTSNPEFFRVETPPRDWLAAGRCYVQDPSTAVACELLAPQPGDVVLDACAAPGGKTAYLAQMMGNKGRIIATDAMPRRVKRMEENFERLHVTIAETPAVDWTKATAAVFGGLQFDRILIDAPCSNTGVMRRRVDVRWRLQPWFFKEMTKTQSTILDAVAPLLKPGGSLVYSTCSLDHEENEEVVQAFLQRHPALRLKETRSTLPWRNQVDGAFAALITKSSR
ncbi:16S rRNA (cytosine967-C5)-methyltransferase [Roseimicrobium gellanilyticum]|uniref:16S rRNA (cytosine(967)-C(5))-methyltransferase n=1 Tax=Roseimicrobium gellanilyticum TaxID=748857 RepID=A0A366HG04_9BACT|nr:16S rRNA (cytosine(967)-C(5))-methyltransferase RsmB [Roseimicrobium gellanilyticum]RBP41492.1 16S rRNA (cytosine967-C5)-methyltransferase [Roseimicrobium gellanilyticum]